MAPTPEKIGHFPVFLKKCVDYFDIYARIRERPRYAALITKPGNP
jgi:hypothetical protein